MSLFKRVHTNIIKRKERILSGLVNCIPWGFTRFEKESPGIEQGKYYLITANSKVGKTQIADWLFLYNTIRQVIDDNLKIRLKIFYFTLEMSKEQKMLSAFSNIIYVKEGIRVAPKDLKSTRSDNILSDEVIELIAKYQPYFEKIEEIVEFIDDIRNPTGIFKFTYEYAMKNGIQHKKVVKFTDNKTGDTWDQEIDDYYEPHDPEEYVMVFIDHISLISTEKKNGIQMNLHQSIVELSSNYLVRLRNNFGYIPVVVQQQAAAQESLDNFKLGKLKPTASGLGDCKLTFRDADLIIGLFSPFIHEIKTYLGFDIMFFKDNIRFLEIVGGREGGGGTVCPLYFDGAVNYFKELPSPNDSDRLKLVYQYIEQTIRQ
jgi:hypothetical protein